MPAHRIATRAVALLILLTLLPLPSTPTHADTAGSALMVKDINAGSDWEDGSLPHSVAHVGSVTYFAANDGSNGSELWRSDGTAGGTRLVADIVPGVQGSNPHQLVGMNGIVYFAAASSLSSSDFSLWRSDGTAQGTYQVATLRTGNSFINLWDILVVNTTLYILADDGLGTGGRAIWRSDGTTAGTSRITMPPNAEAPVIISNTLASANNQIFFVGHSASSGAELWVSNGTPEGTSLVKDINPREAHASPDNLVVINGTLFFTADDGGGGSDLWSSNGTAAGTSKVKESNNGQVYRVASAPIAARGRAFFPSLRGICSDEGCRYVVDLWQTDGTDAGTTLVAELGPHTSGHGGTASVNYQLRALNDSLLVLGTDADGAGWSLWTSDGTGPGTRQIKTLDVGRALISPSAFAAAGTKAFFVADNGTSGYELWQSNGTGAGTTLVEEIRPGYETPFQSEMGGTSMPVLSVVNSHVYFAANDGSGLELWKSNGTPSGTSRIKDINPNARRSFNLHAGPELVDVNGTLFFSVVTFGGVGSLWKSDGTPAGTVMVRNFSSLPSSTSNTYPRQLTAVNNTLFFLANGDGSGVELWKSDGTEAGTVRVKDINQWDPARISSLTNVNGTLFFAADDDLSGRELWKSDGTEAGTTRVKDINPGYQDSNPSPMVVSGSTLFFSAGDKESGVELWKSDGTEAGTVRVKDINPGIHDSFGNNARIMIAVGNHVYFTANDGRSGLELWRTDGTNAGTTLVKDIYPGSASAFDFGISFIRAIGDLLLFAADDGVHGRELWRSDGTPEGTALIKDIYTGPDTFVTPRPHVVLNNVLIFGMNDGVTGYELWRTDGTAEGTTIIQDINPGPGPSLQEYMRVALIDGQAYFSASDGRTSIEVWRTDGTVQGTHQVQDIATGPGASSPSAYIESGKHIFFIADDNIHGSELWAMPRTTTPSHAVTLAGPTTTVVGADATFSAELRSTNTSAPITYAWDISGRERITRTAGLTDTLAVRWETPGTYTVTVTASKGGTTLATHSRTIDVVTGAQALIDKAGGSVTYTNSQGFELTLVVPPDAVQAPTLLRFTPDDPVEVPGFVSTQFGFRLDAYRNNLPLSGFAFQRPTAITITYPDTAVGQLVEQQLGLRVWNGSAWVDAGATCQGANGYQRAPNINQVTVSLCALGSFVLVGQPAAKVYMPLVRR